MTKPNAGPNVQFRRPELSVVTPQYRAITDCIAGEPAIKKQREVYLPKPNPTDKSAENTARYEAYLLRAVFYNVAQTTLAGLIGQIFTRDPVIVVPDLLQPVIDDVDGSGVTAIQLAKKEVQRTVSKGRSGLLTDFPTTSGNTSRQDLQTGKVRPTITGYAPEAIINWRTKSIDGLKILVLVVIEELFDHSDDIFQTTQKKQWRVLMLIEGLYEMRLYKETALDQPEIFKPTDADGKRLTDLPFTFVGSVNNDSEIDLPPLYSICSLNIAHYRNSADYEESSYQVGQPTPWFAGLTEDWVKEVMKGKVYLGSRAAVLLPVNASAGLLQANPNQMPFNGMEHKETQMIALGAKLITPKNVEKTATEASNDNTAETSVLASSANNVSEGMKFALEKAALFVGAPTDKIEFKLNTDFASSNMTAQQRVQLVAEWVAGAISFPELRENLRKSGVTSQTDEEALTLIDAEMKKRKEQLELEQTKIPDNDNEETGPTT